MIRFPLAIFLPLALLGNVRASSPIEDPLGLWIDPSAAKKAGVE